MRSEPTPQQQTKVFSVRSTVRNSTACCRPPDPHLSPLYVRTVITPNRFAVAGKSTVVLQCGVGALPLSACSAQQVMSLSSSSEASYSISAYCVTVPRTLRNMRKKKYNPQLILFLYLNSFRLIDNWVDARLKGRFGRLRLGRRLEKGPPARARIRARVVCWHRLPREVGHSAL